jgi:hypothetical protein
MPEPSQQEIEALDKREQIFGCAGALRRDASSHEELPRIGELATLLVLVPSPMCRLVSFIRRNFDRRNERPRDVSELGVLAGDSPFDILGEAARCSPIGFVARARLKREFRSTNSNISVTRASA